MERDELRVKALELAAFRAGWQAAQRYADHEWGPAPPSTPEAAFRLWKSTCVNGHTIRIKGCTSCEGMKK